jgi:uncharacterized protein (TIGR03437 family)
LTSNSATPITFNYGNITPPNSWLSVSQTAGTFGQVSSVSPAILTITGNAFGQTSTSLNGSIVLNAGNGVTITISVTFQIGTGGGTTGSLLANPNTASLSYPSGTQTQLVYVSSSSTQFFYASSGATWIAVNGISSGTVGPVQVGQYITLTVNQAVAATLGTGTYNTTVTLTNVSNLTDITTIPVSLSVNGASGGGSNGVAAPSTLTFAYQSGGTAPYQVILVNGGVVNATFAATAGSWTNSSVVPSFTTSSNQVFISVPAGFTASGAPAVNTGTVTVTNPSGLAQQIPITLTVYPPAPPPTLLISPGGQGDYTCTYVAGQQACGPNSYTISASDGSSIGITTSSSVQWATVGCSSPSTPSVCTIQVNASGLPNGFNTATVTVTPGITTSNGSVTIPIAVMVTGSTGGGGGFLTLNPASLTFTTNVTSSQTVSVNSSQGGTVTFSISTDSTWLSATATNGNTTPSTVTVTANPAGLVAGQTYHGNVNLVSGGTQQQIAVTMTVSAGGNLTVTAGGTTLSPTVGLTFTSQSGAAAPAGQAISVNSATGATGIPFTYSTTAGWLVLNTSPSLSGATQTGSGVTAATLYVLANPSGLTPTTYSGTVTVTPTGGGTGVTFPVSYTVTAAQTVSASPTSMTFSYTAGSGNVPPAQTLSVSGNGTFSATAVSSGNWCQVNPTSGTAPASLSVTVANLDSLNINQTYTCTITVAGTGTTTGSTNVTVTLTVTAPLPTILKVTNAASFNSGAISAGEIITVFGTGLGPSTGVSASPANGQYPTTAGGVQVLVGGYPAAMIYASATQVSAVVPYEINRPVFLQSVNVQVKYLGQSSNGVVLTQVAAAPGIFTANSSGTGPGAILNSNLSVNSPSNPASAGSTVVLYVTGEGQTIPAGVTGKVTSGTAPFTVPVQAPTVTINGQPAQVAFYAEAPTLVAGILQVNVVIPQGAGTGDLPVVVSFGGASSQLTASGIGAVTVSVR